MSLGSLLTAVARLYHGRARQALVDGARKRGPEVQEDQWHDRKRQQDTDLRSASLFTAPVHWRPPYVTRCSVVVTTVVVLVLARVVPLEVLLALRRRRGRKEEHVQGPTDRDWKFRTTMQSLVGAPVLLACI